MATPITDLTARGANTDGSELIAVEASDAQAYSMTMADVDRARGKCFNVLDYGAVADAVTDCAQAFRDADAAATAAGGYVFVPPVVSPETVTDTSSPRYMINSTVVVTAPWYGVGAAQERRNNTGANRTASVIGTTISDGSAVLEVVPGDEGYDVRDIYIHSGKALPTVQNAIAFKFGRESSPPETLAVSWGNVKDIRACGFAIGVEASGWTSTMSMYLRNCTTGLKGSYLNRCLLDVRISSADKPLELTNCDSVIFQRFDAEGSREVTPSTIDSSSCVTIMNWGQESAVSELRTTSWLQIGFSTFCRNVYIMAGTLAPRGPTTGNVTVPLIELDKVEYYHIGIKLNNDRSGDIFRKTHRTRFNMMPPSYQSQVFWHTAPHPVATGSKEARDEIGVARNVLPMPYITRNLVGATTTTIENISVSSVTDSDGLRFGQRSMRLTGTNDTGPATIEFAFSDPDLCEALARGQFTVGAWIRVPAVDDLIRPGGTHFPTLTAWSHNGSSDSTVIDSALMFDSNTSTRKMGHFAGGWNFFYAESIKTSSSHVLANAVSMHIKIDLNSSGGSLHPFYLGALYCAPGHCAYEMMQGKVVQDSPMGSAPGKLDLRLTQADTASLEANSGTFAVGDKVTYKDVTAGGVEGRIYTPAGWKDFGSISA